MNKQLIYYLTLDGVLAKLEAPGTKKCAGAMQRTAPAMTNLVCRRVISGH